MSTPLFRVRFVEWQSFAKDISADTADEAIQLAQSIRNDRGTIDFDEMDGGTDGWDAEELPSPLDDVAELRKAARLALHALNTARCFKVDDTDSYAIAAILGDCLNATEGGRQ
jgi:hypothetical protein